MSHLIRTARQDAWVSAMLALGVHEAVRRAYMREEPMTHALRYLAELEDWDVIRRWVVEVDDSIYLLEDPDTEAPLYVAGARWDELLECAAARGVAKT